MITTIKDLEKLLKLCRRQGVLELKLGVVEFKLGELPQEQSSILTPDAADPFANFPNGELSPEQLAFYSSGGLPESDPYRDDQ